MANKQTAAPQESAVKTMVVPVIVLVVICVVCSAILAVLNDMTAPIIEENTRLETLNSYIEVLPEGTQAEALTQVEGDDLTTEGVEGAAYTADGAVAVKSAAGGYSGKTVTVYVAFDSTGTITNIKVDASTQTAGIGTKTGDESFYSGFVGWDGSQQVSAGSPVDAIAGATVSSKAVFTAVNQAIDCYNNELKGVA